MERSPWQRAFNSFRPKSALAALTIAGCLTVPNQAMAMDPQGFTWTGATVTITLAPTQIAASAPSGSCTITVSADGNGSCSIATVSATLSNGANVQFTGLFYQTVSLSFTNAPAWIKPTPESGGYTVTGSTTSSITATTRWAGLNLGFAVDTHQTESSDATRNLLRQRAERIVAGQPNLSNRLSLGRKTGFSSPSASFSGAGNASLALSGTFALAHPSGTIADDPTTTGLTGWFQTSFSQSRDDVATTRLGMAHLGVDYRLTEDFLVGVMGQYDHTSQKDRANNTSADGDGWLAGPYFVTRFDDFTLDGRALWGSASNSVSPDVRISDTFRSSRELYQLGLTGRFAMSDELAILPNIRVVHFSETSDSYVNGLGAIIDRQSVHVGQMTFGPEFEYRPAMNQDFTVFFGAKGVWDFDASNGVTFTNGTTSAGSEELRLRLQASANLTVGDGVFSLSVSHDGLGQSDFAAFTAHVGYHHQF